MATEEASSITNSDERITNAAQNESPDDEGTESALSSAGSLVEVSEVSLPINHEEPDQDHKETYDAYRFVGSRRDSWQSATIANLPPTDSDEDDEDGGGTRNGIELLQDDDTWVEITKRDRPLSNANAIGVMDHAYVVLKGRLSDASDEFRERLKAFDTTLGRFQNSEFRLGRRIASGNFADIYLVRSFRDLPTASTVTASSSLSQMNGSSASSMTIIKACTPQQLEAAEEIKRNYKSSDVVVKVLRGNLLMQPSLYATAAADLITEGTLLASLDHPHIVTLLGRSVPAVEGFASGKRDSVFLVLERLMGDLTQRVVDWKERNSKNRLIVKGIAGRRDCKAAILRERIKAMAELADAMAYLHERNVIHRDLKLSNVGIDAVGSVKLIDFGLAKVLPAQVSDKETFLLTGNTGSMRYMAPEVARGERYNLKADVYSFSVLLYEVLNLEKAYSGLDPQEIIERIHYKKQRPRISLFWPPAMRNLLKSTWSDIPSARLPMKHVQAILVKEIEDLNEAANIDD